MYNKGAEKGYMTKVTWGSGKKPEIVKDIEKFVNHITKLFNSL